MGIPCCLLKALASTQLYITAQFFLSIFPVFCLASCLLPRSSSVFSVSAPVVVVTNCLNGLSIRKAFQILGRKWEEDDFLMIWFCFQCGTDASEFLWSFFLWLHKKNVGATSGRMTSKLLLCIVLSMCVAAACLALVQDWLNRCPWYDVTVTSALGQAGCCTGPALVASKEPFVHSFKFFYYKVEQNTFYYKHWISLQWWIFKICERNSDLFVAIVCFERTTTFLMPE